MVRAFSPKAVMRFAAIGVIAALLGGCQHTRSVSIDDSYPVDHRVRHPILVGPGGARVAHACGQWPDDLGDYRQTTTHRPHWNYGCASQQNLAAMVANPNDLLHPQAETAPDAARRQTNLTRYRAGTAPGPHTVHNPMVSLTDLRQQVSR